jgi:hypothetical protein
MLHSGERSEDVHERRVSDISYFEVESRQSFVQPGKDTKKPDKISDNYTTIRNSYTVTATLKCSSDLQILILIFYKAAEMGTGTWRLPAEASVTELCKQGPLSHA